jgi:hypothetical protein
MENLAGKDLMSIDIEGRCPRAPELQNIMDAPYLLKMATV